MVSPGKFEFQFGVKEIPALAKGPKYGQDLETAAGAQNYSEELCALILYCLMHDPSHRISSKDLLSRITGHVRDTYGIEDDVYESKLVQDALAEAENARLADEASEQVKAALSAAEKAQEDCVRGRT